MINRPDFVNFILEDTHSRVLKDYIENLESNINKAIKYLENHDIEYKHKFYLLDILRGDINE